METRDAAFRYPADVTPHEFFQQFVDVFESRGWLGMGLRIRQRGRTYRVVCSDTEFLVYRINEHGGVHHGIPGWPVCMVNQERLIEDRHMTQFESTEPCAYEWLVHLAGRAAEII